MMNKFAFSILLSIFLIKSNSIQAQLDTTISKNKVFHHYLSVAPLSLFKGTFRADYEYILESKGYALVGTAMLGSIMINKSGHEFTRQVVGVEIGNKLYSVNINSSDFEETSFYLNMGFRYQRFTFEYQDDVWRGSQDENTGLLFYRLTNVTLKPVVQRFSLAPQVGLILKMGRIMADFYIGTAIYREVAKGNEANVELPLNGWNDLGLDKMTMLMGVKLGILF